MTFSYGGYDEKSIGLLGFILYFIYLLVCSIRTFIIWRDEEDLEPKVVFHLVLSMNAGLECIYFVAMLINDRYNDLNIFFASLWNRTGLVGYAAHMLALLTNVIAFSVVIYLWTSIISYKRDVSLSKYILGGFVLLNMGCTLAGVIDLCKSLRLIDSSCFFR